MSPRASVGGAQKQPRIKARPLAWRSAHWSAVCAACCARSRANGFYGCWASHSARFCRPMGRGSVRPGSDPFVRRVIVHPVEIVKRILVQQSWPGTPRAVPAAPRRQQAEQAEAGECQNRWLGDTGRRDRLNPGRGAHQGGVQRHRVELARSRIAGGNLHGAPSHSIRRWGRQNRFATCDKDRAATCGCHRPQPHHRRNSRDRCRSARAGNGDSV